MSINELKFLRQQRANAATIKYHQMIQEGRAEEAEAFLAEQKKALALLAEETGEDAMSQDEIDQMISNQGRK